MSGVAIDVMADNHTIEAYRAASEEERRKIGTLLGVQLGEYLRILEERLENIMDEIGRKVAARGMTPEILESILGDPATPITP